jgi:hypothetical protein
MKEFMFIQASYADIEPPTKRNLHHFLRHYLALLKPPRGYGHGAAKKGCFPRFLLSLDAGTNTESFQGTICRVKIHNR